MRYDWTPASEPPDTDRAIVIWLDSGEWYRGRYHGGLWFVGLSIVSNVMHWRDVEPPEGAS